MRRLLTVEDSFLIQGRGLLVVPTPLMSEVRGPGDIAVHLHLPDGGTRVATLTLLAEMITPPPTVHRWACLFMTLEKSDVPIGTELWCADDVFLSPTSHEAG